MSSKWAEDEKERILRKRNPQNAEDVKQNMLEKRDNKKSKQTDRMKEYSSPQSNYNRAKKPENKKIEAINKPNEGAKLRQNSRPLRSYITRNSDGYTRQVSSPKNKMHGGEWAQDQAYNRNSLKKVASQMEEAFKKKRK